MKKDTGVRPQHFAFIVCILCDDRTRKLKISLFSETLVNEFLS